MKKILVSVCIISLFFAVNAFAAITETGMSQGDLVKLLKSLKSGVLYGALGSAGMTTGFYANQGATADQTAPLYYKINGVFYNRAASTNLYLTKLSAQTANTYCYYLFSVNAAGAVTVTKGKEGASTTASSYPEVPANQAAFAGLLVKTSAASAFTMGSSSFSNAYLPFAPVWYQLSTVGSGYGKLP